jgi:hypothetical protein
MNPLDYGRSLLIGKAALNEVRFWVESRTRIIDPRSGRTEDYIQAGACKSENTFAPDNLFITDNYDFLPVFGPEWGVIFRRKATAQDGYRSCQPASEMWAGQRYHLVEPKGTRLLESNESIREAAYDFVPLVAQTEIWNDETQLRAIIEYPVKTLNTHRQDNMYQVDTGPVVLPDLSGRHQRLVDGMRLAFIAFNVAGFADLVIEERTPVGAEGKTYHYSELLSLPAKNRLYAHDG